MAPPGVINLPSGDIFRPTGLELVQHYLLPKAVGDYVFPGLVAEGVDVFSATPDALPFSSNHRRDHGEVWGYFFASQPIGDRVSVPAPGGRWFSYGEEKEYGTALFSEEPEAFRRRLRYHVDISQQGGSSSRVWAPTPWLMTEFRLNKHPDAVLLLVPGLDANLDCVVRKVFTKPADDPPLPYPNADDESTGSNQPSADEGAG